MNKADLVRYRQTYKNELFDSVIPFWLNNSLDRQYGGYFSCLERNGTVFDTDKYAWMQGREIWMFSKLCCVYGARPEWLEAAGLGVDFMRAHGRAPNGDFYFSLDRKGSPLSVPYNIFTDCFMCVAYAEYARASGDKQAREDAAAIYRRVQQRKDNPKGVWTKQIASTRALSGMAFPMIQMMMAREMRGLIPDDELMPVIRENLDVFFDRHVDRNRKRVFERVLPDGGRLLDVMEGRLLNPGHALEILWFVMDIANSVLHDQRMVEDTADIMLWCAESGWDKEYGGLYYYQDYMGYPTDKIESAMKLWWVHNEAINAMLLAAKLTGSALHEDWFIKLHDYSFGHFSDRAYGEWYGYLDRRGTPVSGLKGGKWKGFYHLARMLMTCEQWLDDMIKYA